jgi:hypothetical protein
MAEKDWETIKRAVEDLNSGNPETALALCTDGVVLHLGQSESRPVGLAYHGRDSIRELWHETIDSIGERVEVKALKMLSDGRHLVLFVEAILGAGPDRRTKRVVLTGTARQDAPWSELWAEFDDLPLSEGTVARA